MLALPRAPGTAQVVQGIKQGTRKAYYDRTLQKGVGVDNGFYITAQGFSRKSSSLGLRWVSPLGQSVLFPLAGPRKAAVLFLKLPEA